MRIQTITDTLEVENHTSFGKFIAEMVASPTVSSVFPAAAPPLNGGCLLLANALHELLGRGEHYVMIQKGSNKINIKPVIEHFMLGLEISNGDTIMVDANGAGSSLDALESLATSKYLHGSQLNSPGDFIEFKFSLFEQTFGRYSPHASQIYPLNDNGRQASLVNAMRGYINESGVDVNDLLAETVSEIS